MVRAGRTSPKVSPADHGDSHVTRPDLAEGPLKAASSCLDTNRAR